MKEDRKRGILVTFLLAIFVVYCTSTTFFVHLHRVNGILVMHSHPYSSSSAHSHSSTAMFSISLLSHFLTDSTDFTNLIFFLIALFVIFPALERLAKKRISYSYPFLRAPPFSA